MLATACLRQVLLESSEEVDKCVQLYETLLTRHTTMVVGATGGGKSVILNTLARAQTRMNVPTKLHILNPKAQSVAELYGVMDPDTRDWTDGLLSNIFRELNKPLPPDKQEARYIVFDGDVDAVRPHKRGVIETTIFISKVRRLKTTKPQNPPRQPSLPGLDWDRAWLVW